MPNAPSDLQCLLASGALGHSAGVTVFYSGNFFTMGAQAQGTTATRGFIKALFHGGKYLPIQTPQYKRSGISGCDSPPFRATDIGLAIACWFSALNLLIGVLRPTPRVFTTKCYSLLIVIPNRNPIHA